MALSSYQEGAPPETEPLLPTTQKKEEAPATTASSSGDPWWCSWIADEHLTEKELKCYNLILVAVMLFAIVCNIYYLYEYHEMSQRSDFLLINFKPLKFPMLLVEDLKDLETIKYPLQEAAYILQRAKN